VLIGQSKRKNPNCPCSGRATANSEVIAKIAGDDVAANLNPVGRIYYSASTVICVLASLAQGEGTGLGAQAGEKKIGEVVTAGGFKHLRRATETPFDMVFEARP
jgi:hypothetical protein